MTTENVTYQIVRLEINRLMRIKGSLEIIPKGNTVTLCGDNKAGKSSIINAIAAALGGKEYVPEMPIHEGASKGHVICDLDNLIVTRRFSASGGSNLLVTAKDGTPLKSPQALLDSLWNQIALDPMNFVRLSETPDGRRKQLEILRKLIGLDFTAMDAERAKAYSERTMAGRELETAQGRLKNYQFDAEAPAEEIKVSDLVNKLQRATNDGNAALEQAREHNEANQAAIKVCEEAKEKFAHTQADIEGLQKEIVKIEELLAEKKEELSLQNLNLRNLNVQITKQEEAVAALVWKVEDGIIEANAEALKPIKKEIEDADGLNSRIRANRRYRELEAEVKAVQQKVDTLSNAIQAVDTKKAEALAGAKFPMPGLSFGDNGVRLDGKPFEQGSQAEQVEAAVAIGLALDPKIRVVLIRDASLFDEHTTERIVKLAVEKNAQVFLEKVESNDPAAIIISDGAILEEPCQENSKS